MLICMQPSTSVRVSRDTRDAVRDLADADGVTLDEEIQRLARAERQRRMGAALARVELDADDRAWIDAGARTVHDRAGG
jgi:hypothetical protein